MLATPMVQNYWVTWFPGACLALLGVMVLGWKAARWLVRTTDTMKQVALALPRIEQEFSPNGGGSMRDAVDRQEQWQAKHARDDDRRFAKVEAALERIEDHYKG